MVTGQRLVESESNMQINDISRYLPGRNLQRFRANSADTRRGLGEGFADGLMMRLDQRSVMDKRGYAGTYDIGAFIGKAINVPGAVFEGGKESYALAKAGEPSKASFNWLLTVADAAAMVLGLGALGKGLAVGRGNSLTSFSGGFPTLEGSAYSPALVNLRSAEFYSSYGTNSLRGTMSNVDARIWYKAEDAKILGKVYASASLENQAKQAFNIRNSNRIEARELMFDRVSADRLTREEANMTWVQITNHKASLGYTGDDIFRSILNTASKTRASINKLYGLD